MPATWDCADEFDTQVETLVRLGYPALLDLSPTALAGWLEPLRDVAKSATVGLDGPRPATMPFCLVIDSPALNANRMVELTHYGAASARARQRPGRSMLSDEEVARFRPIAGCDVPSTAYLVLDVQRGAEYCGQRPSEVQPVIEQRGRSGLTIAEGIALITHNPASLERNKCFMLLSSRAGDARVPALWIADSAPKLGWCWWNNWHTWLGFASCGERAGMRPA